MGPSQMMKIKQEESQDKVGARRHPIQKWEEMGIEKQRGFEKDGSTRGGVKVAVIDHWSK